MSFSMNVFNSASGANRQARVARAPRAQRASGFTLMEIMIVVAIIGLMAAMGLPSIMMSLKKEGMRKAVSDFEDVCFEARKDAIIHQQTVSIAIYPQDGRFGVAGAEGGNSSSAADDKVRSSTLPDGIVFKMVDIFHQDYAESERAVVNFYRDGTCDEGFFVLSGRGDNRKIVLDYATGLPMVSALDQ